MTLTEEKIREASVMGVLWEPRLHQQGHWRGPFSAALAAGYRQCGHEIRPYNAAGHITLHDGSGERPEWVKPGADILVCLDDSNWYRCPAQGRPYPLDWAHVKYFIVLPEVTP